MFRAFLIAGVSTFVMVTSVSAQATALPSFNAPYRAFDRREAGGTISFPNGGDVAFEGLFRFARGRFDLGLRGGLLLADGVDDATVMVGLEARQRILDHDENLPADGSLIFGAGARLGDANSLILPVGVSFGRRLDVEDSEVSIIPFLQPTGWLVVGDNDDFLFGIGIGADFRLTRLFDLRASVGFGDIDGVSLSAVWVR